MAEEVQKIVYFPEIPAKEEWANQEDKRLSEDDILPYSIGNARFKHIRGENTAYGQDALYKIIPFGSSGVDLDQGRRNTMVGYQAGFNIKIGHDNVAIGKMALYTLNTT